jgi:hypothetical protein
MTVHRSNNWFANLPGSWINWTSSKVLRRLSLKHRRPLTEIGPGAECWGSAGEDNNADAIIGIGTSVDIRQSPTHGG